MKLSHMFALAAVACGLAAGSLQAGSGEVSRPPLHSGATANLVIKRAPNFGNEEHFNIFLDGVRLTNLGYGETYHGVVPAGDHLITMIQMPHFNDAYPMSHQRIRLTPGQTRIFTAIWRDGGLRISLEPS